VSVARVLLIVNPASRRGFRHHPEATRAFAAAGVACEVVFTTHPGHAALIAAGHDQTYDAVFTLGGDGTVMEVLGAVACTGMPVGVLPGGTGNLTARALGITPNIGRAVRQLVTGKRRQVDLGTLADGRYFAFAAGIGIDAAMVAGTTSEAKRLLGVLAYVRTATRASLAVDAFDVRAIVDGADHRFRATAVLIANFGSVLNGFLQLGPEIRPDDGMLDLCVFCPENVTDALRMGWRIARKRYADDPAMHFLKGRHIRIETDPARPAQADGELMGTTPVDVRVAPLAACFLVPR
jgi:diacylglycerol kinase (ATP)